MKIGVIILCRYNSSRLPGKILKNVHGKPILEYIIERIKSMQSNIQIVVATSQNSSDKPIWDYCEQNAIPLYKGELEDVSHRFLNCAEKYTFDYAFRINGDNIFVATEVMLQMLQIIEGTSYDFISNVKGRTFPSGMSVELVKISFYKKIIGSFTKKEYKEHVTLYFYEHENSGEMHFIYNDICPELKGINLAIDTLEDFNLASKIIQSFKRNHETYGLKEINKILKHL